MLDISNAACTSLFDISNAVKVCSFPALTVFTWAGNPHKSTVGPTRPGIRQEAWCHLWWSGFRYYLRADLTFGDQLREWDTTQLATVWGWNVEPRWRRAQVSLLAAFVEVWCVFILFVVADWHIRNSSGLVINRDPQLFTFIVKAASVAFHGCVWCYIISGELVYSALFTGDL